MLNSYYLHKITPKHIGHIYDSLHKAMEVITNWKQYKSPSGLVVLFQKIHTTTQKETSTADLKERNRLVQFQTSASLATCAYIYIQQKSVSIFQIDVCRKVKGSTLGLIEHSILYSPPLKKTVSKKESMPNVTRLEKNKKHKCIDSSVRE